MPIRNLVVLMMENRSFDHALGYMRFSDPASPVEGLRGTESNPVPNPPGGTETVGWNAAWYTKTDPGHEYEEVVEQLFGGTTVPSPPVATNDGYVASLAAKMKSVAEGRTAMHCFTRDRLPALYALADEFAVCDHWFCSVPGPTWPNRFFVHAASSNGSVRNKLWSAISHYDQPVVYESLSAAGVDWRIYFSDIAQSWALKRMRKRANRRHYRTMGHFEADARNGRLPPYTFIEPRYFDFLRWKATDQHPGNHVELGDELIARVYEALRSSPHWPETLLVIVYDEHGGLYDHVPPPYDGAVVNGQPVRVKSPGKPSTNPPFAFDRLGPRVPAVLVSPCIARGTVDHTVYEHSSVPATLKKLFGLPDFLNERDRNVNTFEGVASGEFRADTPETLPRTASNEKVAGYGMRVLEDPEAGVSRLTLSTARAAGLGDEVDVDPLNDLQKQLVELAHSLDTSPLKLAAPLRAYVPRREISAAAEVRGLVAKFMADAGVDVDVQDDEGEAVPAG